MPPCLFVNFYAIILYACIVFNMSLGPLRGLFLLGCRGAGAAEAFGVADEVDVHIGTLSKAVGAHGGFVACRADVKTLLLNKGRPYVFSTAPPAPVVAAAIAALQVAEEVTACTHGVPLVHAFPEAGLNAGSWRGSF